MSIPSCAAVAVFSVLSASATVSHVSNYLWAKLSCVEILLDIERYSSTFRSHAANIDLFLEPALWKLHPYLTIAVSLLFLTEAALIGVLLIESKARRLAQASIARRFALERVVSALSTTLADCPPESIDRELEKGLKLILEAEAADRACWFAIPEGGTTVEKICSAHRPGIPPGPARFLVQDIPWIAERLARPEPVAISNTSDFPPEAAVDRKYIDQLGVKSIALVPSSSGTAAKGLLILVHLSGSRQWPGA